MIQHRINEEIKLNMKLNKKKTKLYILNFKLDIYKTTLFSRAGEDVLYCIELMTVGLLIILNIDMCGLGIRC